MFFLILRGNEFRKDFKELSCIRAYFPEINIIAVTATASPITIKSIKESLCMKRCKEVTLNPNRENIYYLNLKKRDSNISGMAGYEKLLLPIAKELYEK